MWSFLKEVRTLVASHDPGFETVLTNIQTIDEAVDDQVVKENQQKAARDPILSFAPTDATASD